MPRTRLPNPLLELPKVSQTAMAKFLGVSPTTLANWTNKEWVTRANNNQYDPTDTVRRLVSRVARVGHMPADSLDVPEDESEADPRLRKWRIEADLKQIELDKARDLVIEVDDVAMVLSTVISGAKQVLRAMPTTILSQHPETSHEVITVVRDAVHFALTELANTDVLEELKADPEDPEDVESSS